MPGCQHSPAGLARAALHDQVFSRLVVEVDLGVIIIKCRPHLLDHF